jgi:hypothetical protein
MRSPGLGEGEPFADRDGVQFGEDVFQVKESVAAAKPAVLPSSRRNFAADVIPETSTPVTDRA